MSENTLQLRLQYFVGESLEEWLTRQAKIDIIQFAEGRPEVDTYSHDIELDEVADIELLNYELGETWGSVLSQEQYSVRTDNESDWEPSSVWERPVEKKMRTSKWKVEDGVRKAVKRNKKIYNLKSNNRPVGWTEKWWENTPVHPITELR